MDNINKNRATWIIVLVIFIYPVFSIVLMHNPITVETLVTCFSKSVTIFGIFIVLFCRHLWKYRIFKGWLVNVPNLNGLWMGKLKYKFEGTRNEIDTELVIKQSLFRINCKMTTGESESVTISSNFIIDSDKQKKQLIYSYFNEPDEEFREKSPIHYGTTVLNIECNTLRGRYWTDRKTKGTIILTKHTK